MRIYAKQLGFTLVELVIVIALFGVLAAVAVPSYQQMIQNSMIRTATDSIQTGFQIARGEAVKRNTDVQFDLIGAGSDWTVCTSPAGGGSCPAIADNDATTVQSRKKGAGSSATIVVTPDVAGPYVFNGFGVMTSPGAAEINVSNTASGSDRPLRVVVGIGGSVKTCDPALPAGGTDPRRC